MFGDDAIGRRTFVRTAVASALGTSLAGCGGGDGGGDGDSNGGDSGTPRSFDGWMDDVDDYDGVVDRTGQDEVTVTVGAEGNGGNFAFDPAGIEVSRGTTVVWEWNGMGGQHNVAATEGGDFESDLTAEEGFTFEHTFDSAGVVKYQCDPHASLGMKGVVVVE